MSQLAMVNDDFARYWSEICAIPTSFIAEMVRRAQSDGYCPDDDPQLIAVAIVAMFNQFCYLQLTAPGDPGRRSLHRDIDQPSYYRAIYFKEDPLR